MRKGVFFEEFFLLCQWKTKYWFDEGGDGSCSNRSCTS